MVQLNRPVEYWLEQIVYSAERLAGHVAGISQPIFQGDLKTIDAACWCIGCIGEAAGKILQIDPEFENRSKGLALLAAYDARNRYIHGYFNLDEEQIWQTATIAVPEM